MIRTLMLGALQCIALLAIGCDQCGCGLLPGIQPFDRSNYIGLQYRLRYLHGDVTTMTSLTKHGGHGSESLASHASYTEIYQVLEARAQFWLGQRLSVIAAVPFVNNYGASEDLRYADIYAAGDPQVMLRYAVINGSSSKEDKRVRHRVTLGIGTKPPLARHDLSQYGQELDHDLQPGTGTWDMLVSVEHLMRGEHWGTAFSTVGRINGTNENGHRMGHSGSATLEVFRASKILGVQWFPSVGAYAEYAGQDRQNEAIIEGTGNSVLFTHLGSRVWWRSIGFSIAWQHAALEDRGSLMIPNRERFVAGITYNFNKTDQ